MSHLFQVGDVTIGGGQLFLIAGPCVIESEAHALKMAEAIAAVAREKKLPYIFKASYDKANRTSIRSFRGPGLEEGLRILRKVRETAKVPVLTDVHEAADVPRVAEAVDVLQIPAFLCRQTDLLVAAGKSGRAVNIKKGQFVSPWDMRHAVEKVREAGASASSLPSAARSSATTISWWICGRWPSCESSRPWFSTRHTRCSFLRLEPLTEKCCGEWRPARIHSAAGARGGGCGRGWRFRRGARQSRTGQVRRR